MAESLIDQRKKKVLEIITNEKVYLLVFLLVILYVGASMRLVKNDVLKDEILALDPYLFFRWTRTIVEEGSLPRYDTMRQYPIPYDTQSEARFLSYVQAHTYKFLNFLDPRITITNAVSWYPVIFFVLAMISFFLLTKHYFGNKTSIFATSILTVASPFLYRTFQGFADKEALGIFLFFTTLLFYLYAWNGDTNKWSYVAAALCGLFFGLLSLTWGTVMFMFIIIGAYSFLDIFFHFTKEKFYKISIIIGITFFIMLATSQRYGGFSFYGVELLLTSFTSLFVIAAWGLGLMNLLLSRFKEKIETKLPLSIASLIVIFVGGFIVFTVLRGPTFYIELFNHVTEVMIHPFETARHTLTVVENRQPFFGEWKSEMGVWFLWMFMGGAWLFWYDYMRDFSKKWVMIPIFTLLLLAIPFSRYSSDHILNGTSGLSIIFYLGSFLLFILSIFGGYLYAFFKDKELYKEIMALDKRPLFMILWFFLMAISARGAIRLFFIFTPVAAIFAGYVFTSLWAKLPQQTIYKILVVVAAFLFVFNMYGKTMDRARSMGPSFSPQWKEVTTWIRTETVKESVFSHWWDYGYWIQTMGERPTILDGGQPMAAWNYFLGRHVLTGQNESEALDFLYAHNASYLLIDPSDIGKYMAYSNIGSDPDYDRLSYVQVFGLANQNEEGLLFSGQYGLDEDATITRDVHSAQALGGGVTDVFIELNGTEVTNTTVNLFLSDGVTTTEKMTVPLSCLNYNGNEYYFGMDDPNTYQGCFVVIPFVKDNQMYPSSAGVFMSRKGKNALWTKLYLRNHDFEHFELVYQDKVPLAVYDPRGAWGPIKVWKITYPEDIEFKEEFLSHEFPEGTFWASPEYKKDTGPRLI